MKKQLLALFFCFSLSTAIAQVGINTTTPAAQLDVRSSNQTTPANTDGILIPKVDTFPAINPSAAQNGMMVFLTTAVGLKLPGFYYWDSTTSTWIGLASSTSGWALSGNTGTTPGTDFLGTTDATDFVFKTDNIERARFTSAGLLGIGTTTPNQQLELTGNFRLPVSTATTGIIYSGVNRFVHNFGGTYFGISAGNLATTSSMNTGIGQNVMQNQTTGNFNVGVGATALASSTGGYSNSAVGYQTMTGLTTGGDNTAMGSSALRSLTTGGRNVAIGSQTMVGSATSSSDNVAVGYGALTGNGASMFNTAIGSSALNATSTGSNNTAVGRTSMQLNTTGSRNTALGYGSLFSSLTSTNNTAIGYEAGRDATGTGNVMLGYQAGYSETGSNKLYIDNSNTASPLVYGDFATNLFRVNGTLNINNAYSLPTADGTAGNILTTNGAGVVSWSAAAAENDPMAWLKTGNAGTVNGTNFIGTTDNQALDFRTNNIIRTRITTKGQIETLNTGNSVFVGEGAGANDDLTDNRNTFIGLNAGQTNTTATFNTGIGYQALQNNTSNGATAVGYNALQNYTGIRGTAVGFEALKATTTGSSNTAVGYAALSKNTTGGNNTAMGNEALLNITTGSNNTGFGKYALLFSTTATQNTAVGVSALHMNNTGGSNTAMGYQAMGLNSTGNNNVALGLNAMYTNTTGSNNMALGSSADVTTSGLSNASAIGYNAKVATSNSMVLGGTGADAVKVGIGTTAPAEELEVVGDVRTSSLAGTGTRMVQADANGTLTPLAEGTASQVLLGTGVWGSVPGITNDWSLTGNTGTVNGTNFIGTTDNQALDVRTNNIIRTRITNKGQIETLNTGNSVFVGEGAGESDDLSDNNNVNIGYQAGASNITGTSNVGIGYQALQNGTASEITAIGNRALQNNTATRNTAIGYDAMKTTTTGADNTAVGYTSLNNNITGFQNVGIGVNTLFRNTTGSQNTTTGTFSLSDNTTGIRNTANGYFALNDNITGSDNTGIGGRSLMLNNTGSNNSGFGYGSLLRNTSGNFNVALGYFSGQYNLTGSYNIIVGAYADVISPDLINASAIGYNAKVATSNSMVLGGTGADAVKVGIGTTAPAEELEVVGDVRTSSLAGTGTRMVQADANGTLTPLAEGTASQVLLGTGVWGAVPASTSEWSLTGNAGTDPTINFIGTTDANDLVIKTNSTETARMTTAGNFGIGTNAPASRLHIKGGQIIESGTLYMNSPDNVEKILLTDWGDNGSKINTSWNFSVDFMAGSNGWDTDGNHRFFTSVVGAGFTERMRIHSNGNVGIGSTAPTQAKLVVNGTQDNTLAFGYLHSDGTTGTNSDTGGYSVYASGRIAATEFNAFSDERIKNVKGVSESNKDLETLKKIQITDYTFKDTIGKGTGTNKKVIAQQVKEVYPQAVTTITDVIPDIYAVAKIKDGRVILKNNLQKGDRVKLVFENRTEVVTVLQADEYGFNVALQDEGKVFVFGREVNDFHTVDYEALATLNISATQELIKIINQQEAQIQNLKADNADMNKRLSQTEADINEIKSILNSTVSDNSK